MKIQKIEIEKIRGIKKITIEPNGENTVIFGPNGSGKSAVIDAIDFLLTGKISRLEGEGTGELSIRKHGPHINSELKEAAVKAEVKIPGVEDIITIERRMNNRELIVDDRYKDFITPILELSSLGQHLLSRREILRYILSRSGERAEKIYAILNLADIEESRKTIIAVKGKAEKEYSSSLTNFERVKNDINIILGIKDFSEEKCLTKINENRAVLKAEVLKKLEYSEIKKDINQPTSKREEDNRNLESLKSSIGSVMEILIEKNKLIDNIFHLKEKITGFNNDIDLRKEIGYRKLVELGLELVDDHEYCPLCEKPWDLKELINFLKKRLFDSEKAVEKLEKINSDARNLSIMVQKYYNYFNTLDSNYKSLRLGNYENEISKISNIFTQFNNKIENPIESKIIDNEELIELLLGKDCEDLIENIKNEIVDLKYTESPDFDSWDILTKLEVYLKQYNLYKKEFIKAEKIFSISKSITNCFENSRNIILNNMFDEINDNFIDFYKILHGEDEKEFKSSLIPEEARLVLEVDFYKKGMFPPGAVHSEGHQDSMGICLFFSLNRFLAENKLNIIVLDDVVMSVDSNHRRNFCNLLKNFPNTQFIITTHDRLWAKQLRTENVVKNNNMIEFKWWSIESGPTVGAGIDLWNEMKEDLNNNDVPMAAWKLRRNGECFLNDVCDMIKAKIIFKSDGNWDFGDYLQASVEQYKKLIKCAKKSASSWNNKEKLEQLEKFDNKFTDTIKKTQSNQWAINPNVHYSKWADFQPNDFKPVVDAFNELFNLFICKECGNIPKLILSNMKWEALACPCKKFLWNLKEKQ